MSTRTVVASTSLLCGILAAASAASGCRRAPAPAPIPQLSQPTAARVGLSDAERAEFYHLDEGSEVFPLTWFRALESESGGGLFAQNLERFGFLPDPPSASNPHGLPVGLTGADTRDLRFAGVKMVGVNCAACHTSELLSGGRSFRLDGAGGHADITAFYGGLAKATVATVTSPRKFLAFLDRVRTQEPNALLSARDANRSAAVFRTADVGALETGSAFDKELQAELVKALDEEMQRPAEPLQGSLTLKPGAGRDAAEGSLKIQLTRDLSDAAMARRVPPQSAAEVSAVGEGGPFEVRIAATSLFKDSLTTLRLLKARVAFIVRLAQRMDANATVPGFGRIDAFGGARNLLFDSHTLPTTGPVSYPHLWNFERVNWLHWDANTTSVLERNIGQALGLGAVLDPASLASTVSVVNLHRLEHLARKIKPPRWEEIFGPVDEQAAARGAALFGEHCASCHAADTEVELALNEIGTDPNRAVNFAAPVGDVPNDRAIADLIGRIKQKAFDEKGLTPEQRAILDGGETPVWRVTTKYAGRPLIAPWATAPLLHNNSVPTLDDLLLPPDQRPKRFFAGSREYDRQKLGFVTTQQAGSFLFDTTQPGNANGGHVYGTGLSAGDRASLLEYLKKF